MKTYSVQNPDGSRTEICYPSVVLLNQVVLGRKVQGGGLLLDVELTLTPNGGWSAKSRSGITVSASRAGKLRDKTQFIA